MIASMWVRYFSKALRPAGVMRNSVRGMRPSNDLSHAMYSASSSFRAWTLRLPSVVRSSRFRSLNVSRSFTASALTMPSRRRSWMRRSRSSGPRFGGASGFRFRTSDFRLRASDFLPTVSPRNDQPEHDVQAAEAGGHQPVPPRRGRREPDHAESHEAHPHDRHDADREGAAGRDRRAVEQ